MGPIFERQTPSYIKNRLISTPLYYLLLCCNLDAISRLMERWQSGRMHRFRKPAEAKASREFESPPLRKIKPLSAVFLFCEREEYANSIFVGDSKTLSHIFENVII